MNTVLDAIRVALASYRTELQTLVAEEENVALYVTALAKRKARLERDILDLTSRLAEAEKGDASASAPSL